MPEFLQFLFSGLTIGAIYALVALGFTLIYNASDVINFAQGEFVMIGGMVTFFARRCRRAASARCADRAYGCGTGRPCCCIGSRSSRRAAPPPVTLIIITIGASIFLRGVAAIVFDKNFHSYPRLRRQSSRSASAGRRYLPQSVIVLIGALRRSWSRSGRS